MFARGTFEQHTSRKENKLPKIVYVALVRGGANGELIFPDVRISFSLCLYGGTGEPLERNRSTITTQHFTFAFSQQTIYINRLSPLYYAYIRYIKLRTLDLSGSGGSEYEVVHDDV